MSEISEERMLLPGEVARMFGVQAPTLARWAKADKIRFIWTPGGHRRYRESDVSALLARGDDQ